MLLQVEDLSVNYGVIRAVKGVSFEVNEGEIVSLIGANGAGKTTILKTISGLMKPSGGKIIYNGHEIQKQKSQKKLWQAVFLRYQKDDEFFFRVNSS